MKVGFIGLGNMGNPMALNVLKAGHELVVYDVRREVAHNLEEAGANWAGSPKEVALQSEVVLTSLPGPAEVEAVVTGSDGIFAGLDTGGAYIDMSTNSPTTMRKLAADAEKRGLALLDAPVTGGVPRARNATLTVFVGGDKAYFESFQPLLSKMGSKVLHMGPVGCGNVTKLVNNLMAFINFVGASEGLAIGAKAGVDPQALLDAIKTGSGNSMILEFGLQSFVKGEAALGFTTALAAKDLGLAVELGKEVEVPAEIGPVVETIVSRFRDAGHGQDDLLALVRDFIQRSGVNMAGKK